MVGCNYWKSKRIKIVVTQTRKNHGFKNKMKASILRCRQNKFRNYRQVTAFGDKCWGIKTVKLQIIHNGTW